MTETDAKTTVTAGWRLRWAAILALALIALLPALSAPKASAADPWGNPDLGADGYYAALTSYVNWLAWRKTQGSVTAAQKQGFRDQVGALNQQALWSMGVRHQHRINVAWTWNRNDLARDLDALKRSFDAEVTSIVNQYNRDVETAKADRDQVVKDLGRIRDQELEAANAECQGNASVAAEPFNGKLAQANQQVSQVEKRLKRAKRAAAKARKRFGKRSKQARRARRVVGVFKARVSRVLQTRSAIAQQKSQAVAGATSSCQQRIAKIESNHRDDVATADANLARTLRQLGEAKDEQLKVRRIQYDNEVGATQRQYDDGWGYTVNDLNGVHEGERAAVMALRDRGQQIIASMPQK